VVECTGLENQQSRKVLVGSNPTASAMYQAKGLKTRALLAPSIITPKSPTTLAGALTNVSPQHDETAVGTHLVLDSEMHECGSLTFPTQRALASAGVMAARWMRIDLRHVSARPVYFAAG
jgi:hypothetical protein